MRADPIGIQEGMNHLYAYAINNPVNLIDPWGLDSLKHDLSDQSLSHLDNCGNTVKSWPAVSGPHGDGPVPPGDYTLIGGPVNVPPEHPNQRSYCDPNGNCWWQPIGPSKEDGYGIHPDENVPGTRGCIGATDNDTSDLYDFLKSNPGLNLEVVW